MRFITLLCCFTITFFVSANTAEKKSYASTLALQSISSGELLSREKLTSLFDYYSENSIDSLYIFGNQLIETGLRYENWFYINYGKSILASYFNSISKVDIAIQLSKEGLDYALNLQDHEMICWLHNQIGISYVLSKKYKEARKWFEKSLASGKQTGNFQENCMGYKNIAESYYREGNFEKAIDYATIYIKNIDHIKSKGALAKVYNTLGNIYRDKEDMKKAELYYTKSLETAQEITSALVRANALNNLAIVYFEDNPDKAKEYFIKAFKVRQQHKNPTFIADSYLNLGTWHYIMENVDSAIYYYQYMYDYCVKHKYFDGQIEALEALEEVIGDMQKSKLYNDERTALQKQIAIDRQRVLEEYIEKTQPKIEEEKQKSKPFTQNVSIELPYLKVFILLIIATMSVFIFFSYRGKKRR
ncbi:MAG TPA: tetratricopeptide repeat protein [Crocinitomicaceae bacterium]|nr:tetratricopeptide repeat protein [Crocinitomicaceae bacterium]